VLNLHNLETAARQLANRLGLMQACMPPDGFDVFVPPEAVYDASKAAHHIWRGRRRSIVPVMPPYVPLDAERSGWPIPRCHGLLTA
jgi:hypothetical protein